MAGDILGISISGLRVSQNALRTTGHNIANANTEGFSRQTVEFGAIGGIGSGVGFLGNGAQTANIERVVNQFVVSQTRSDTSLYNELKAYNDNILKVNDLLSNQSTGLTQGLQSFFAATQTAADDPTALSSRQLLISEAENLSDRFNTLHSRLSEINEGTNEALETAINQINTLSNNIATLNKNITDSFGASNGNAPNDLLDQRDEALRRLSELVSLKVTIQDDNQINVALNNGIPLVLGFSAQAVSLGQNEFDPLKPEILTADNNTLGPITNAFNSGEVGGLLNFQNTLINTTYNEVGRIGLFIADNFNQLQQQGLTLNNNFGTNIFFDINNEESVRSRIFPAAGNSDSNPDILLSIRDVSQLQTSDYRLDIDDTSNVYTVTRLSDDTEVASSIMPVNFPISITFDGLSFDINSGTFDSGDKFLIQPTRNGAREFQAFSLAPEDLALGSPILTDTSLGNLGNASISAGEVLGTVDATGQTLSTFAQSGQLSPPVIVRFTSATTYDVLDNSNPGNPTQLSPPIRNQTYVPGVENNIFTNDIGQTTVTSSGSAVGLPNNVKANLAPTAVAPSFAVSDFSNTMDRFSFDVVVSNTVGAANDGTFTVTINSAALTDNSSLLADINDDLAASNIRATINDSGTLSFLALNDGAGDITLQNYNNDPDGDLNTAPVGQANALLGFALETTTFTTVADANGLSGSGTTGNDYPAETFTITRTDPASGLTSTQSITTTASASARTTASLLDNVDGVSTTAFNYAELRDFSVNLNSPLQITLNGQDLVEYEGATISSSVPAPSANSGEDFNDYLADAINNNSALQTLGITAVSAFDATANEFYIQLHSTQGDDFSIEFSAADGESIEVNDGVNNDSRLIAVGVGASTDTVIGGRFDITLENNLSLSTSPSISAILGDSTAGNFSQAAYLGMQAAISGTPQTGDEFTIGFNTNAASDNRNGLAMVNLQQLKTIDDNSKTYNSTYNQLVESVGIKANASQNNTTTAENVLEQSTSLRNSISGVNLDEEASNLIKFEQLYSANAQVISVAREIFDRLLNSF